MFICFSVFKLKNLTEPLKLNEVFKKITHDRAHNYLAEDLQGRMWKNVQHKLVV